MMRLSNFIGIIKYGKSEDGRMNL